MSKGADGPTSTLYNREGSLHKTIPEGKKRPIEDVINEEIASALHDITNLIEDLLPENKISDYNSARLKPIRDSISVINQLRGKTLL